MPAATGEFSPVTCKKEPVAHGAAARRAIAKGLDWADAQQMLLPLGPVEGISDPTYVGEQATTASAVEDGRISEGNVSRKEKIVRHKRVKSPVSVVDIKRAIAAVQRAGLPVATLDVRPDGVIRVGISAGIATSAEDVFAEWADRL